MEAACHLFDACPVRTQCQDLSLPVSERAGPLAERGHGQLGVEALLSSRRSADRDGELVRRRVLEQKAADTGLDSATHVARPAEHGENQGATAGQVIAELTRRRDP